MKSTEEVRAIVEALKELYPDGICSLDYEKDYELLFSVRLAAQCTDERVNKVTPALFARFPTWRPCQCRYLRVEQYIHSTGFSGQGPGYRAGLPDAPVRVRRQGARHHGGSAEIARRGTQDGQPDAGRRVPRAGVVVADTHCIRITGLLGLTDGTKDPGKVEKQLRACLPPEESNDFCHRLVLHGRAVCIARRPQCQSCVLRPWCDHFAKSGQTARGTEGREPA